MAEIDAVEWYVAVCRLIYANEPYGLREYRLVPAAAEHITEPFDAKVTDEARDTLVRLGWTPPKGAPDGGE